MSILESKSIISGGRIRPFLVETPNRSRRDLSLSVIVLFHGHGGSGAQFREQTALSRFVDSHRLCCLWLDGQPAAGAPKSWNAGPGAGWAKEHAVDDVAFVTTVLSWCQSHMERIGWGTLKSRRYAWGFSNGAVMAARLACELPGGVRGLVTCGATQSFAWPKPTPTPSWHVHGIEDGVSPIGGGIMADGYDAWSAEEHVEYWRSVGGARAELTRQPDCGHDWPGPGVRPDYSHLPRPWREKIGPECRALDLSAEALKFCKIEAQV